jgi:hypothetical protein
MPARLVYAFVKPIAAIAAAVAISSQALGSPLLLTTLKSQDKQFRGAGQWASYDYPNPQPKKRATAAELTHLDRTRIQTIGLDVQFRGAGQWQTYDYPNPGPKKRPWAELSFTDPSKIWLAGKDTQFGGAGQWAAYDYPNPKPQKRLLDYTAIGVRDFWFGTDALPFAQHDWTPGSVKRQPLIDVVQHLNTSTLGVVSAPFAQQDWPISLGKRPLADLVQNLNNTLLAPVVAQAPFIQGDWPNPTLVKIFRQPTVWRVATVAPPPPPAPPFFQTDYPNPLLAQGRLHWQFYDQFQSLLGTLLAPLPPPPFVQTDYPNPMGRPYPSALRIFQFYYVQDQTSPSFLQYDWPNPAPKKWQFHESFPNLATSSAVQPLPFALSDWPNPLGRPFPKELRTWLQALDLLIGKDQFFGGSGQGPANLDWPNPLIRIGVIDLRTETLNPITLRPPPAPQVGFDIILVEGRLAKRLAGRIYIFLE